MTSIQDIKDHIKYHQERYTPEGEEPLKPIFEIALFEHPDKEMIYHKNGQDIPSGFPDAPMDTMGFYYELETAIQAMNENWCDIQETVFHAGFIFCKFPGLYQCATQNARMYFLWDEEKKGFFQAEEPEIFHHIAY